MSHPTKLSTAFSDAASAAGGVRRHLSSSLGWNPISARPFNLHRPDDTQWWVIPSTDWPAFKYGKLSLSLEESESGKVMYCALNVEKGIGPAAAAMAKTAGDKRAIVTDEWIWHDFLSDMRSGKIEGVVHEIAASVGDAVVVRVCSGTWVPSESRDADTRMPMGDICELAMSGTGIEQLRYEAPGGPLAKPPTFTSLAKLPDYLESVRDPDWSWVDVYLGVMVTPGDADGMDAADLWTRLLRPWGPWLR